MGETIEAGDATDRVKPWTVKGIAPEERNAAIAAADREGLTIGEWSTRAIRTQVQADHRSDRLPIVTEIPASVTADRQSDLADLERLVSLFEKLATANGQPIPSTITCATYSLMREHLRSLKASSLSDLAKKGPFGAIFDHRLRAKAYIMLRMARMTHESCTKSLSPTGC